jgi:hypothetical protein
MLQVLDIFLLFRALRWLLPSAVETDELGQPVLWPTSFYVSSPPFRIS